MPSTRIPRPHRRRRSTAAVAVTRALAGALVVSWLSACTTSSPTRGGDSAPMVDTAPVAPAAAPSALSEGWHHGAFMQILVRAYKDSNGDGIGDLKGLTQSLDHLKDLGVRGLWLMPITRSADGDAGYATTDHRSIEPAYGTMADFDELIREAHARGIGVIADHVLNHSAANHAMFVAARENPKSLYRDWYLWSDAAPVGWAIGGVNPWHHVGSKPWLRRAPGQAAPVAPADARNHYFASLGPELPDFNLLHAPVVNYHLSSLRFWLNRGLDGFRLGAASNLVESGPQAWRDQPGSRKLVRLFADDARAYEHRYVVCESAVSPQAYAADDVCGAAFSLGLGELHVRAAKGDAAAVRELADHHRQAPPSMANTLSGHDQRSGGRLWTQVQGDMAAYRLAVAGHLLQPGTPFIYYGDEIGQGPSTDLGGDTSLRGPMSWTADVQTAGFTTGKPFRASAVNVATHNVASQREDRESMMSFYRDLLGLRNDRASIARGTYDGAFAQRGVWGFQRAFENERTLVVINYGRTRVDVDVSGLPRRARIAPLFPRRAGSSYVAEVVLADAGGRLNVSMPPRSVRIFDVEMPSR